MRQRIRPALSALRLTVVSLLLATFLVAVFTPTANAVGTYSNAAIADKALTYWNGSNTNRAPGSKACADAQKPNDSGGQCRAFVNCIVWMVSGHTQNLGGSDYFQTFLNAGGVEVPNTDSLVKGDIVQVGQGTHTFIIVSKVSAGQYMVVDSNHWGDETVGYYQRAVALDGSTTRAFRMGSVTNSSGGGTTGQKAKSDVDGNGGADLVLTTREADGHAKAMVALSTYQSFLSPAAWWNGVGYGWDGVKTLIGDVTGDGKADYVFLTNEGANGTKAFVAKSTGSGFSAPQIWWDGVGYGWDGIKPALADVDNNGAADLVLLTREADGHARAMVLLSTWQSFLSPATWWDGVGYGWSGITPFVRDVSGDNRADLVFLTNEGANGTKAFVVRSTATSFGAVELWWNGVGYGYTGIKAAMGDVDGNAAADLVLTTREADGHIRAMVLLSTWQSFLSPTMWGDWPGYGWDGVTPMVGDLDGNGRADYVFLTNEGANGTKAFVVRSTATSFGAVELWWNGVGYGYTGIKATLS